MQTALEEVSSPEFGVAPKNLLRRIVIDLHNLNAKVTKSEEDIYNVRNYAQLGLERLEHMINGGNPVAHEPRKSSTFKRTRKTRK